MFSFLSISFLLFGSFSSTHTQEFPPLPPISEAVVSAGDLGLIQGNYSYLSRPLYGNREFYYYFTGLPYANVNSYTGQNRFKPSAVFEGPLTPNGEVFNATNPFIWCPQPKLIELNGEETPVTAFDHGEGFNFTKILAAATRNKLRSQEKGSTFGDGYTGQEDCLIATVSTPKIQREGDPEMDPKDLFPVLVFLHGGGFNQFWGSVFGGHRLLNRDVVLVSINMRLGILGSLNLGIDEAPGSALVYDSITVLQWIQKYIKHFGGDPNRVTVSGQSAGAVLSTATFLSPLSKDLIHGAIGASGSAYSIWATNVSPMEHHIRLATFTSCNSIVEEAPSQDQIDFLRLALCIRSLELGELVQAQVQYSDAENLVGRMGYDALVPSVQSPSISFPRAVVESPSEVLKNKRQSNVPLMMGVCRHDGSFVFDTTYFSYLVANDLHLNQTFIKNDFMRVFLEGVGFKDKTGALLHSFLKTYVGEAINYNDFNRQIPGILDIHTVIGFKAGGYGLVEQHAKLNQNSYYYAFDYKGMWSTYLFDSTLGTPIPGGIAHVDDLIYLFQFFPIISENDIEVTKRYVDYWVNFATYGNPNGEGEKDEPFPRYDAKDHKFLIINVTDKAGTKCRDTWIDNSLELMY